MPSRSRLIVTLVSLTLAAAAHAQSKPQSCTDLLRHAAPQPATVSATELAIPRGAWQHFERARTATERNQPDLAEVETARALAIAPRFGEAWLLRAVHKLQAGYPADALSLVTTARAAQPGLPWAGITAASALNALHRFDEAATEIQHARSVDAESWQASYELARAETGRGNISAALHWSELAVAAAPPGCTGARLVRANALHLAGQAAQVVTQLEAFLAEDRLQTRRTEVLAALSRARAEAGTDRNLIAMK